MVALGQSQILPDAIPRQACHSTFCLKSLVHVPKLRHKLLCMTADPKFWIFAGQGTDACVRRACLLAACGWDAFQLSSLVGRASPQQAAAGLPHGACEMQDGVVACGMCGTRVGLWSFAHQPGQTDMSCWDYHKIQNAQMQLACSCDRLTSAECTCILADCAKCTVIFFVCVSNQQAIPTGHHA